jgi:hypothetical protein
VTWNLLYDSDNQLKFVLCLSRVFCKYITLYSEIGCREPTPGKLKQKNADTNLTDEMIEMKYAGTNCIIYVQP